MVGKVRRLSLMPVQAADAWSSHLRNFDNTAGSEVAKGFDLLWPPVCNLA